MLYFLYVGQPVSTKNAAISSSSNVFHWHVRLGYPSLSKLKLLIPSLCPISQLQLLEFFGHVPLMQRLPSCSMRKIAELVQVKNYDNGDYVVREGEHGDGVYFIWEGEAEVSAQNSAEESHPELHLKKYDYFGYRTANSLHLADIVALSKLICLVLRSEHCSLLQPKSIWNEDETLETRSLVENILQLEPIEVDLFRGFTLPEAPKFAQVFGGQLIGQALAAASKTVDCLKFVHSLHAYFLLAADLTMPIMYRVSRARDGKSFATRQVEAIQQGNVRFTLMAAFQKEEEGFEHQDVEMPIVPSPDTLLPMEGLREQQIFNPRLPIGYRNRVATTTFVPWPIEIRFCDQRSSPRYHKLPPRMMYWFKARGKLSDDPALHRCVVAYASDLLFLGVTLYPHREKGLKTASLSLDHSMWFHRSFRADEWLLFVIHSPSASNARGFCSGRMFNTKGQLIVTLAQEGVTRKRKTPTLQPNSKL